MKTYTKEGVGLSELLNLNLKDEDRREVIASSGLTVVENLLDIYENCTKTIGIYHEGSLSGVFGIDAERCKDEGIVIFLLTDDRIKNYKMAFLKQTRTGVNKWLDDYPDKKFFNYVDSRHVESIKWLTWLNADIDFETKYFMYDKTVPFYKFTLRRTYV